MDWQNDHRPGYFGRARDAKVAALDAKFGRGNWRLAWVIGPKGEWDKDEWDYSFEFQAACSLMYEESYFKFLSACPDQVEFICQFEECYDNALTNIQSGLNYMKQEAFSTHIQDIAVRNCLKRLGVWFTGANKRLLQIRSADSDGWRFNPGQIMFHDPALITQPSKAPKWAQFNSVEDFWQSNKWVQVLR